jgi:hypothetical protein
MTSSYSEGMYIEQPGIALFDTLGCVTVRVCDSYYGGERSLYATGVVM